MIHDDRDPALDPSLDQPTRRSFLKKTAATAAVAAAAPIASSAAPQEKRESSLADPSLTKKDVTFKSGDRDMKAFLIHPGNQEKRGSVIVIHEIFGLNDHIKDVAGRLAQAGYTTLAVNFFTREGDPPAPPGGDFRPLMEFVNKIPDSQVLGDILAAAAYLRALPTSNGKVGDIGFCWGGYYAMLSAAAPEGLSRKGVDAAVAYYGRIRLPENADRTKKPHAPIELADRMVAPLLGHFGEKDGGIPQADANALAESLKKHDKPASIHVYEGAGHAFNNDTREAYHAPSAKQAWERTLAWYAKYLK
jgi:carboxymethylenebutenolidase